jgi:hypothetical protein
MHYGEPLDEARLAALLRPDAAVPTVITADVYGEGEADRLVGRAVAGLDRGDYVLVGAIGHDFYTGQRQGARGFPRFTDPALRSEADYAGYIRMATERSLERCGADRFDLLLLHNPDRTGYSSPAVWEGLEAVRAAGLTDLLGVAPGPANGFTLDLIDCLERFGPSIDWAMIILNPLEPWSTTTCGPATSSRAPTTGASAPQAGWRRVARSLTGCARSRSATGSPCCSSPVSGTSPTPPCGAARPP